MFNCKNCNKEFKGNKRYLNHIEKCSYQGILYTCIKCFFMSYNFHEMTEHKQNCSGTNVQDSKILFTKLIKNKIKKKPKKKKITNERLSFLETNKEQDFILYLNKLLENNKITLTPIEKRILQYDNYYEDFLNSDEIEEYKNKLSLSNVKLTKNYDNLLSNMFCYGIALFSIENIITFFIGEKTKNLISYIEDDNIYHYRFYYFSRNKKNQKYWKMDCRLENLCESLTNNLKDYIIKLFKKIYYKVFGDNNFRDLKTLKESNYQVINTDCIQLLSNLIKISDTLKIQKFLQDLVIKTSMIIDKQNNNFNLLSDDRMQLQNFKEKMKHNYIIEKIKIIKMLFDDSNEENIKLILNEINI